MRIYFCSILVIFLLFGSNFAIAADQQLINPDWRTSLQKALATGDLAQAMDEASLACVPAAEVVEEAIKLGHDSRKVLMIAFDPGSCPGGCICGTVRGAVDAGVSRDVIINAAKDAGIDLEVVEKGLVAGEVPDSSWHDELKKASAQKGTLEQAIVNPIAVCISPGKVVKTAIETGHKSYTVLNMAINAAGPECLCDAVDGAFEAGMPANMIALVAGASDAACCPQALIEPEPIIAPPAPVVVRERIILRGILFDYDRYVISPESLPILNEAIAVLNKYPDLKVLIEGHACARGTDAYNQRLSERRARSVRNYLVDQSVPADRLQTSGYGETKPFVNNETEENRRMNRRVEFVIIE